MKRCENGHFFDEAKHTSCPYCGVVDDEVGATMRKHPSADEYDRQSPQTRRLDDPPKNPMSDETIRVVKKQTGIDPVVGWLVCITGPEQGRDYRIRSERNFIGRSPAMDICVQGDDTISRENHAVISYNPRNAQFSLLPGEGRGLIYVNSEELLQPLALKAYDEIELGQSRFLFVPLCGERFQWPIE